MKKKKDKKTLNTATKVVKVESIGQNESNNSKTQSK